MAERALWHELRHDQLGCRFRRQHPIPPYIVDFARVEAKLILEADGGQHGTAVDQARDRYLWSRGWRILRLWNHDILKNRSGILQEIADLLAQG